MGYEQVLRFLAFGATLFLVAGPSYFFLFWRWFAFWRRRRALTYLMFASTFAVVGVLIYLLRHEVLTPRLVLPVWVQVLGWVMIGVWSVIGMIADRQLGLHVRSFGPHFQARGRIVLLTTGAYGIVRHPIYSAGIFVGLGIFLATGYAAVLASCAVFTQGALWFTRREEERTMALLDDASEYVRYRARVPALFPRLGRRGPPRGDRGQA